MSNRKKRRVNRRRGKRTHGLEAHREQLLSTTYRRTFIAAAIIVSVGMAVAVGIWKLIDTNTTIDRREVLPPQQTSANERPHALVEEISSQFYCGCGECGEMNLSECVCTSPNGGLAEKHFIDEQLKAGVEKESVIKMVDLRYGRRITASPAEESAQ